MGASAGLPKVEAEAAALRVSRGMIFGGRQMQWQFLRIHEENHQLSQFSPSLLAVDGCLLARGESRNPGHVESRHHRGEIATQRVLTNCLKVR